MIGENIKNRRIALGLSQWELAERMGYNSNTTISKIERNVNDVGTSEIAKFAEALETTIPKLMGWENVDYTVQVSDDLTVMIELCKKIPTDERQNAILDLIKHIK